MQSLKKSTYNIDIFKTKRWFLNKDLSILHREDGPAIEYYNGDKYWYINNKLHRKNGPAVEYANGNKWWYINGNCHREDGPAIEYASGDKAWYLNGKQMPSQEEFERLIRLKAFW